jgi:hypothetical protein
MAVDKMKQLLAEGSVKQLVADVDASLGLVRDIKATLKKSEDKPDVSKWMETLNKLDVQRIPKRTVIGKCDLGSGKNRHGGNFR